MTQKTYPKKAPFNSLVNGNRGGFFPPKKILVPMDDSNLSMNAWDSAYALARQVKATCEAAYIQEYPILIDTNYAGGYPASEIQKETLEILRRKIGGGPHIHSITDNVVNGILKLIKRRQNDLVVMGTHARQGLSRFFMGSVAESVIRDSPVPVLVVKRRLSRIRKILVPVNFTNYSTRVFEYAETLARFFKASVTVFHAVENKNDPGNPWKKIEGLSRDLTSTLPDPRMVRRAVRIGDPVELILKASRSHDLIVLAAHRKSLLKDTVLGTTAERVLRYSAVPVLAVPAELSLGGHGHE